MTNDSKEPFTVQAGKRYNRRGGGVSSIITDRIEGSSYVFRDIGGMTYTVTGHYLNGGTEHEYDLISEYVEPQEHVEQEPTAASVTDEWGPWIGWNGGECPVDGIPISMDLMLFNGTRHLTKIRPEAWGWSAKNTADAIIAYRIKKEPEVREITAFITDDGSIFSESYGLTSHTHRKAIITLTNGEPSIGWADVDDT